MTIFLWLIASKSSSCSKQQFRFHKSGKEVKRILSTNWRRKTSCSDGQSSNHRRITVIFLNFVAIPRHQRLLGVEDLDRNKSTIISLSDVAWITWDEKDSVLFQNPSCKHQVSKTESRYYGVTVGIYLFLVNCLAFKHKSPSRVVFLITDRFASHDQSLEMQCLQIRGLLLVAKAEKAIFSLSYDSLNLFARQLTLCRLISSLMYQDGYEVCSHDFVSLWTRKPKPKRRKHNDSGSW